MAEQEQEMYKK